MSAITYWLKDPSLYKRTKVDDEIIANRCLVMYRACITRHPNDPDKQAKALTNVHKDYEHLLRWHSELREKGVVIGHNYKEHPYQRYYD